MAEEYKPLEQEVEVHAERANSELDDIVNSLRELLSSVTGIKSGLDKVNGTLSKTNSLVKSISTSIKSITSIRGSDIVGEDVADGFAKAKETVDKTADSIKQVESIAREIPDIDVTDNRTTTWHPQRVAAENAQATKEYEAICAAADAGEKQADSAKRISKEYESARKNLEAASKVARALGDSLSRKLIDGGVLKESSLFDVRRVNDDVDEATRRFERAKKAASDAGIAMMEPSIAGGIDESDIKAWSEQNRLAQEAAKADAEAAKEAEREAAAFERLNEQLNKAVAGYRNLLSRRKAKIRDGNIWSSNDVDRAREMSARIIDLCDRMDEYGDAGRKAASTARMFVAAQPKAAGGTGAFSAAMDNMSSGEGTVAKLAGAYSDLTGKARKALDTVTKYSTRVLMIDKMTGAVKRLGKSFGMTLKFYASFGIITQAISSFQTASRYAAKSNADIDRSLSNTSNALNNFKASVTSMLMPLVTSVAPSVTSALNSISDAAHRVGMAMAAIAGQDTYTKMTAEVYSYADSLKEASGALAGFDTLNVLGNNQNDITNPEYKSEVIKLDDSEFYKKLKELGKNTGDTLSGVAKVGKDAFSDLFQYITCEEDFSLMDSAISSSEKFKKFIETNGSGISRVLSGIGKVGYEVGQIVVDALLDIVGIFAGFSETDTLSDKLQKLGDWLERVAGWLKENRDELSDVVKVVLALNLAGKLATSSLGKGIGLLFSGAGKFGGAIFKPVISLLQDANEMGGLGVMLSAKLAPIGAKVASGFTSAGTAVIGFGGKIAGALGTANASVAAATAEMGALGAAATGLGAAVAGVGLGLGVYKALAPEDFDRDLNVWKSYFRDVGEAASETYSETVDAFGQFVTEKVPTFFSNTWDTVVEGYWNTVDLFDEGVNKFGEFVTQGIPQFFSNAWEAVKEGASSLWTWIENSKLYQFVSSAGQKISSAWNTLTGKAQQTTAQRTSGRASNATTATTVNMSVNVAKDDKTPWYKKLFAGNFANGGIVNKGQLFRANERGAEVVGSMDGKTAVANQNQVFDAMYNGIYNAVAKAMQQYGGMGGDINLVAELDGEKVYKSVVKRNKSHSKQLGKNPLLAY